MFITCMFFFPKISLAMKLLHVDVKFNWTGFFLHIGFWLGYIKEMALTKSRLQTTDSYHPCIISRQFGIDCLEDFAVSTT